MTTHNPEHPFHGCPLCHQSGVLPWDFADRIVRLKEASGLTWSGMARALGVDRKQLRRWRRKGVEPCGGAMLALVRFARPIKGGLDILLGEDRQANHNHEEEED